MNPEKVSADVGIMDEEVEAAAVTDKQNEEAIVNLQDNAKQTDNENAEM